MLKQILFLTAVLCTGQTNAAVIRGPAPAWHPSVIAVTLTVAGHDGSLYTKLELAKRGDARISYKREGGPQPLSGTILMIAGRWLLVKGPPSSKVRAVDLLKIEAINTQLVLSLLSKGVPQGPPPAGQTRKISMTEIKEPVRIASAGGGGIYPAPWSLSGSATSVSATSVNFVLDLKDGRGRKPDVHLQGTVSTPYKSLVFPDGMSLSGWTVDKIGSYEEQTSKGTILNYGANKTRVKARTLGELRAAIAR